MNVRAAGEHVDPSADHLLGERERALPGAPLAFPEGLRLRDPKRHGLARDHVHERTALRVREDRLVHRLGEVGGAEDHAGARSAQRLVRGSRYHVGVGNR